MSPGFVGRSAELTILEREYQKESSFVIITGREGMGKTSLLRKFSGDKDAFHFTAAPMTEGMLLRDMSDSVGRFYGIPPRQCGSWTEVFDIFSGQSNNRKVLIIDEYQNITGASDSFVTQLAESWEEFLSSRNVMLILCSSEPRTLIPAEEDKDHPLYGKISASLELGPLSFDECRGDLDYAAAVEMYAVHGGVPAYFEYMSGKDSRNAFLEELGRPAGMLVSGPIRALSSEFNDPSVYISVIRAIASGKDRITQISSDTGVSPTTLNAYLRRMQDMRIVRRSVPVTEYFPERSKSGSYALADNAMSFWGRFVLPHLSGIMSGETRDVISDFDSRFREERVQKVFAGICLDMMPSLTGKLGFLPLMTGRYWNKDTSVDILALNPGKRRAFIAGCIFRRSGTVGRAEMEALMKDAAKIPELRGCVVKIGLFSVTGFDSSLYSETNVLLVDKGIVIEH